MENTPAMKFVLKKYPEIVVTSEDDVSATQKQYIEILIGASRVPPYKVRRKYILVKTTANDSDGENDNNEKVETVKKVDKENIKKEDGKTCLQKKVMENNKIEEVKVVTNSPLPIKPNNQLRKQSVDLFEREDNDGMNKGSTSRKASGTNNNAFLQVNNNGRKLRRRSAFGKAGFIVNSPKVKTKRKSSGDSLSFNFDSKSNKIEERATLHRRNDSLMLVGRTEFNGSKKDVTRSSSKRDLFKNGLKRDSLSARSSIDTKGQLTSVFPKLSSSKNISQASPRINILQKQSLNSSYQSREVTSSNQELTVRKSMENIHMRKKPLVQSALTISNAVLLEQINSQLSADKKSTVTWSGQEVIPKLSNYPSTLFTDRMTKLRIYKIGMVGMCNRFHYIIKCFVEWPVFGWFLVICGLVNTIILGLTRYEQPKREVTITKYISTTFTYIYFAEIAMKIFVYGIMKFCNDPMNVMNFFVAIINLFEILLLNKPQADSYSASLQVFRTLRIFKVVRMFRLLKRLRTINLLIAVLSEAIVVFVYIGILLLLFLFAYALIGMQLFGGRFDFAEGTPRQNYDNFFNAFLSVFQVLTLQNWQKLLYLSMRAQIPVLAVIFYITWLIIGNNILLTLFLAFMLNIFTGNDDGSDDESSGENRSEFYGSTQNTESNLRIDSKHKHESLFARTRRDSIGHLALNKKKPPLSKTRCNYSLYLFSKENKFRLFCWKIVRSTKFEYLIFGLIALSSLILAVGTYYLDQPKSVQTEIIFYINCCFLFFFFIEAILKIIAFGFVFEKGSYLRDLWNILDLIILILNVVELLTIKSDLDFFRVLRLLRVFRTLKYLSENHHIKIIIKALFRSFGSLFTAIIFICAVFIMFSIVGVHFFSGKFQYCTVGLYTNSNKQQCLLNGGQWKVYNENFDNVINGLIYLFGITSQESWSDTIYHAIDCTGVDTGPRVNAGWFYAFYYIIFLFVSPMFLMNIFLGTMFYHFRKAYKSELETIKGLVLTEDQMSWLKVQKMIFHSEPDYRVRTQLRHKSWRNSVHRFVTCFAFEVFITIAMLLKVLQSALFYNNANYGISLNSILNSIFTTIFALEIILKLIGFGCNYWYEFWPIFEFIVLVLSCVDIILYKFAYNFFTYVKILTQLMLIARLMRIVRPLNLLHRFHNLQTIIKIVNLCLSTIISVFGITVFVFFIYTILGCYLFFDVPYGEHINEVYNFKNFKQALIICLKLSNGEDWKYIMYECVIPNNCTAGIGCGRWYAYVYFISFRIVMAFMILNLFALVVIHFFDEYFISDSSIMAIYKEDYEVFQKNWMKSKPIRRGNFIYAKTLIRFFQSLPSKFELEENDPNAMCKQILSLGIRQDKSELVFYNELLYCLLRPIYSDNLKQNEVLQKKEMKYREKIMKKARLKSSKKCFNKNQIVMYNPYSALMALRVTLKLWRKYKTQSIRSTIEHRLRGEYNQDSSIEIPEDLLNIIQDRKKLDTNKKSNSQIIN